MAETDHASKHILLVLLLLLMLLLVSICAFLHHSMLVKFASVENFWYRNESFKDTCCIWTSVSPIKTEREDFWELFWCVRIQNEGFNALMLAFLIDIISRFNTTLLYVHHLFLDS